MSETEVGRARRFWPVSGQGSKLAQATLVNTVGHGLSMAVVALYYTQVMGLSAAQVSTAIGLGAAAMVVTTTFIGRIVDDIGARTLLVAGATLGGLMCVALLFASGVPALVGVCVGQGVAAASYQVARGAIIPELFSKEDRVRGRAFLRSLTNAGILIGTTLAIPAVATNDPLVYRILIGVDAFTFFVTALLAARLDANPHKEVAAPKRSRAAMRDRRFVGFTALNGVLAIQGQVLTFGMPLWVLLHTEAPRWTPAAMILLNTLLVIALQVKLSAGADTLPGAIRAQVISGVVLAAACVTYGFADNLVTFAALGVVAGAVLLHTFGEILSMAGGFGISYELAPDGQHGDYQGTFLLGPQLASFVGPAIIAYVAIENGLVGWAALGGVFVAASALIAWLGHHVQVAEGAPATAMPSGATVAAR